MGGVGGCRLDNDNVSSRCPAPARQSASHRLCWQSTKPNSLKKEFSKNLSFIYHGVPKKRLEQKLDKKTLLDSNSLLLHPVPCNPKYQKWMPMESVNAEGLDMV